MDDLIRQRGIYVRDAGTFVGDGTETFEVYLASGRMRLGRDIRSLVSQQPEQSLERATAEVPALGFTNRRPFRYVPLGFTGNRQKYGLFFSGNAFVGKRDLKLFAEEVAHMLWDGDTITSRIGVGVVPDFRERERSARQHILDDDLPVAITTWSATLVDAALDPVKNHGTSRASS
jgi:hypothetical protein